MKHLISSLPILANVLAKKYGVQVHIGGNAAYTNGKNIYIPALPLDSSEETINLARAYLDHESAHIRYTNFEEANALSKLEFEIYNILEDYRVENLISAIFPGCRMNFDWAINYHFAEALPEENSGVILNTMLLEVRSWDINLESKDKFIQAVDAQYPDLWEKIYPLLIKAKDLEADYSSIAKDLAELLKDNLDITEHFINISEKTRLALNAKVSDAGLSLKVGKSGHKKTQILTETIITEAKRESVALATRLHALLQAQTYIPCQAGRAGKLNTNNLHKLSLNDPKIFLKPAQKIKLNTAVHILLDSSGSMDGPRLELATKATYVLALALQRLCNINIAISSFPADWTQECCEIAPIVKHNEKVHAYISMKADGTTPLAEALWKTLITMSGLRETRKIIFVLTDGEPDCVELANHALDNAKNLGYEVYALGITTDACTKLHFQESRKIDNLQDLMPAMFNILQSALIKTN